MADRVIEKVRNSEIPRVREKDVPSICVDRFRQSISTSKICHVYQIANCLSILQVTKRLVRKKYSILSKNYISYVNEAVYYSILETHGAA